MTYSNPNQSVLSATATPDVDDYGEMKQPPILSRHHDFHPAVHSIFDHAHAMEALYDNSVIFKIPRRVPSLLTLTVSRNKVYYCPHDLQSLRHSPSLNLEDVTYKSRDVADGRGAEHAVYQMSWSVWNNQPCISPKSPGLWKAMQSWGSLGPPEKEDFPAI